MNLNPFILIRQNAIPKNIPFMEGFENIHILNVKNIDLEGSIEKEKNKLIDIMEKHIALTMNSSEISIKRDIFNERGKQIQNKINKIEDENIKALISSYLEILEERSKLQHEFELEYNNVYNHVRQSMRQLLIEHREVSNGLLFLNSSIYYKLRDYIRIPVEEHKNDTRKLDYTLAKFISRAALKTSPFSELTRVGRVSCLENQDKPEELVDLCNFSRREVRVNYTILYRIIFFYLMKSELLYKNVQYVVPPFSIIERNGNKFISFIATKDDSRSVKIFSTTEVVGEIVVNTELANLFKNKTVRGRISFEEFYHELQKIDGKLSVETTLALLKKYVQIGFLVPAIGFIEGEGFRENVKETVATFLSKDDLNELMEVMNNLFDFAEKLALEDKLDERHTIIKSLDEYLLKIKDKTGINASAINVLYEDGIINNVKHIEKNRIEKVYNQMTHIQAISLLFDINIRLQLEIGTRLHKIFGSEKIPLKSEFYEIIFAVSMEFTPYWTNPFYCCDSAVSEEVKELDKLKYMFIDDFRKLQKNYEGDIEEIDINDIVNQYLRLIPEKYIINSDLSSTFFTQFKGEDAIINAMYEGQEKFKARFMDYFLDYLKNSKDYKDFQNSYYNSQNYYEFLETFGFNGNVKSIHLEKECITTGIGKRRFLKTSIKDVHAFEDSSIKVDEKYPKIRFLDKLDKEFSTMLRGSLVPTAMPGYFSCVIQLFTSGKLLLKISDLLEGDKIPRIRYGNLILTRRRISITPHFRELKRINNETDYKYYRRLNTYFYENGLPERFFIVTKRNYNTPTEVLQGFKPLYIDIRNPILLKVMEKDIVEKDYSNNFYFEEFLSDNDTNVSEYDIEIYKCGGESY